MTIWFHTTILATTLAATVAVGVAGAAIAIDAGEPAPKADRLPVSDEIAGGAYVTIETREAGVSVLQRIPVVAN